jgi:type I restriction enzyme S subunit
VSVAIRAGYKQTEVGVIPEDWEVKNLGDVSTFLDGLRKPVKNTSRSNMQGDVPYYGASGIVDYVNDYIFDEQLVLLSEDGENIVSRNLRVAFKISGKSWVNNHAHVIRPNAWMDIDYLTEYLESLDYREYNSGTAQPKLNKQICLRLPIISPPLPEQRAIASALADVDALLASLEALLTKKRQLKQAAMQELLTGKTRLEGFEGKWEEKRLGEFAPLQRGFDLPNRDIVEGSVPIVYSNGIEKYHAKSIVKGPGVVTGRSGTIGKVFYVEGGYWPHNTSLWVTNFNGNHPKFVFYVYKYVGFSRFSSGTGVPTLNRNDAHSFRLLVPPLPEQQAIASILSEMDAELEALAGRVVKTRQLKQGMMQELLTGRTRLI